MTETWMVSDSSARPCSVTVLCDMTHFHARHDSFVCLTWLIHTQDTRLFTGETWLISRTPARPPSVVPLCDMSHSYLRHESFHMQDTTYSYVRQDAFRMRDITHSYVRHNSFLRETWLIPTWDMTHSYVRHNSFLRETWLIPTWDMTHSYVRHDSFLRETWLIPAWDMTHSYLRHDSFLRETWLIPTWDMMHSKCKTWLIPMWDISRFKSETWEMTRRTYLSTPMSESCVRHYLFICETWQRHDWDMIDFWYLSTSAQRPRCVTWLISMCDMTHSYVWRDSFTRETRNLHNWDVTYFTYLSTSAQSGSAVRHDSFLCATWPIPMCDMTHSNVWHDLFLCVTWPNHMCDMTHSYVWRDSFTHEPQNLHNGDATYFSYLSTSVQRGRAVWHDSILCATWPIPMCDMTQSYVWHDSFLCVTRPTHMCDVTHLRDTKPASVRCDKFHIPQHFRADWPVRRLIPTCDMTHSCVWRDSSICVTWLIHTWDMTLSRTLVRPRSVAALWYWPWFDMWHDSFVHEIWLIHCLAVIPISLWCVTWLIHMI